MLFVYLYDVINESITCRMSSFLVVSISVGKYIYVTKMNTYTCVYVCMNVCMCRWYPNKKVSREVHLRSQWMCQSWHVGLRLKDPLRRCLQISVLINKGQKYVRMYMYSSLPSSMPCIKRS